MSEKITFTVEDEDGNEVDMTLPAKFEVCDRCHGRGSVDGNGFEGGITGSEWSEMDQDDRESYMSGDYDEYCPECKGLRVVLHPDEDRADSEILKAYWQKLEADARYRSEERYQQRMGF